MFLMFSLVANITIGQSRSQGRSYSPPQQSRSYSPPQQQYRPNAVPQANPYATQAAYYQAFNRQMAPVYNAAIQVQRVANGVVRYGSYVVPDGQYVRQGYNAAQQYINSRPVNLPQRYAPNY